MLNSKVIRFLRNWQQSYQGVRELSQLDDHELADLGLIRSDTSRVARQSSRHCGSSRGAGPSHQMSNDPRRTEGTIVTMQISDDGSGLPVCAESGGATQQQLAVMRA
jgi:uncharacterized protein YjiS (DUF1127 family)